MKNRTAWSRTMHRKLFKRRRTKETMMRIHSLGSLRLKLHNLMQKLRLLYTISSYRWMYLWVKVSVISNRRRKKNRKELRRRRKGSWFKLKE